MSKKIEYWILAARPKTLAGAIAPVCISIAIFLCWCRLHSIANPAFVRVSILALLFATVMQIDANFINDLLDFKKGSDSSGRLGPKRMCAQGLISPKSMRIGILCVTALAVIIGLPLAYWGGWQMIIIGLLCIVFAFLYSVVFSYNGKGDILVLLFFGIIPVVTVCYILYYTNIDTIISSINANLSRENFGRSFFSNSLCYSSVLGGIAMGIITDMLLIINNYRDIEEDRKSNKKTLIVRYGKKFGERFYLLCGIIGAALAVISICLLGSKRIALFFTIAILGYIIFYIRHKKVYARMVEHSKGERLNSILGATSANIILFALIYIITASLSTLLSTI